MSTFALDAALAVLLAWAALSLPRSSRALDNGLALTPPMGWSSWNYFGRKFNESTFYAAADVMVSSGMADVGYEYVNVDGGWWARNGSSLIRNASGYTTYSSVKYPHGIRAVIDYVHDKGLKYGHYTDAGEDACDGDALMSEEYAFQDLNLFISEYGIDMIKVDACNIKGNWTSNIFAFGDMMANLTASVKGARPVLFSNCRNGCMTDKSSDYTETHEWKPYCIDRFNMWRVSDDINDSWKSVLHNIDTLKYRGQNGQPGAWNDPDFLEVGNGEFADNTGLEAKGSNGNGNEEEEEEIPLPLDPEILAPFGAAKHGSRRGKRKSRGSAVLTQDKDNMISKNRAHFSLWCIVSAPLIAGNNLENMTDNIKDILINKNAIEINQNYLDNAGDIVQAFNQTSQTLINQIEMENMENGNMTDIWYKPMPSSVGNASLLFLNRNNDASAVYNMSVEFVDLPLNMLYCDWFDIWDEITMEHQTGYEAMVPYQTVKFLKLYNCQNE